MPWFTTTQRACTRMSSSQTSGKGDEEVIMDEFEKCCRLLTLNIFFDIHAPDQAILDLVDMLDHPLKNKIPFQVAYQLMDHDYGAPPVIGLETDRFDVRIDRMPLTRP